VSFFLVVQVFFDGYVIFNFAILNALRQPLKVKAEIKTVDVSHRKINIAGNCVQ
jgi:hypothetical protein